ncbi:hypothetical protein BU26DRAFT_512420 [Trematosphaeria pertusa]|uniref:Uncharacterized protein n=1 Tax=Trematosphaeria pertusa TaxID=390896 RepID=A0A6A6HQA0_9PLEO|nr:uncharacterized protein BU26DRAFT_512420 [Trematosphaeria pertusa]KAF2240201.1 hypothetical protein BU26DRAFT_512420 [Trematosphaeria pertusa]
MAPRRRDDGENDVDRSAEYYIQERNAFDKGKVNKRKYGDSSEYLQKMIKQQWQKYFDLGCFFRWLLRESRGSIDSSRSLQTYWNVLCIVRRQETGRIDIDPVVKHQMKNVKQQLVEEFGLRTEPKEKCSLLWRVLKPHLGDYSDWSELIECRLVPAGPARLAPRDFREQTGTTTLSSEQGLFENPATFRDLTPISDITDSHDLAKHCRDNNDGTGSGVAAGDYEVDCDQIMIDLDEADPRWTGGSSTAGDKPETTSESIAICVGAQAARVTDF